MRRFVRSHRVMAMLVAGGLLSGSAGGPPGAALGASGDPPGILFAGEALSAPSYDHIVLVYNTHLDETVPIPLGDFSITVDGAPHAPVCAAALRAAGPARNGTFPSQERRRLPTHLRCHARRAQRTGHRPPTTDPASTSCS